MQSYFSTKQALTSHAKTHQSLSLALSSHAKTPQSLNLALSVSKNTRLSCSLPATPTDTISEVSTELDAVQTNENKCDLCGKIMKTKAALNKHRVCIAILPQIDTTIN